jgi:hypothetical protein
LLIRIFRAALTLSPPPGSYQLLAPSFVLDFHQVPGSTAQPLLISQNFRPDLLVIASDHYHPPASTAQPLLISQRIHLELHPKANVQNLLVSSTAQPPLASERIRPDFDLFLLVEYPDPIVLAG